MENVDLGIWETVRLGTDQGEEKGRAANIFPLGDVELQKIESVCAH